MSEEATNLEPIEEPIAEPEVAPEPVEIEEVEAAEGDEVDQTPETVEVEIDGQTYNVPADLKDGFLRTADYTRKTQELAEQRRQAEETLQKEHQSFTQQVQAQRQNIALYGKLEHTEDMLQKFSQVDWVSLQREDPDQAQALGFQRESLRDQRESLLDQIEKQEHDSRVVAEREFASRKDQLEASLARDIPNYSTELRTEMNQTAIRHGFTERELSTVLDPRMHRMLHLAHLGEQVLKRQTATPKPKPVKPVSKVSGGKAPDKGPSDQQSTETWMKRRTAELRAKG